VPYWNFEYTKSVIYTVVKVGGGTGQGPATEVTHLRLNSTSSFFQCPNNEKLDRLSYVQNASLFTSTIQR